MGFDNAAGGVPPLGRGLQEEAAGALDTSLGGQLELDLDALFLFVGALWVFLMQAGFALLEVGSVRVRHSRHILLKNVIDAALTAVLWWAIGQPFAYGSGKGENLFIGTTGFFLANYDDANLLHHAHWMFSFAFAATATTILSGAVAERCQRRAYLISTVCITGFIYPIVVHWIWSADGWASCYNRKMNLGDSCGIVDSAGSGVVHMVGGCAALMGAMMLGPRVGRFTKDGTVIEFPGQSTALATLGVLILWVGWYAFNGFSTLHFYGSGLFMMRSAVNTTMSTASGALASVLMHGMLGYPMHVYHALNGILAGAVSITAGCFFLEPYAATIVGLVAGLVYFGSSVLLKYLRIDDPVDAAPVHLFGGIWGMLSVGLFAREDLLRAFYQNLNGNTEAKIDYGIFYGGNGTQLGVQLMGITLIFVWSATLCYAYLWVLKRMDWLRLPLDDEVDGLNLTNMGNTNGDSQGFPLHNNGPQHSLVPPAPPGHHAGADAHAIAISGNKSPRLASPRDMPSPSPHSRTHRQHREGASSGATMRGGATATGFGLEAASNPIAASNPSGTSAQV